MENHECVPAEISVRQQKYSLVIIGHHPGIKEATALNNRWDDGKYQRNGGNRENRSK